MLKAKLDSVRKNRKKGFSLVELIIVIAIMVALIAVLAPSYVKYVQKSRDSALQTAAEDFATAMKTYVADPDYEGDITPTGTDYYFISIPEKNVIICSNNTGTTPTDFTAATAGAIDLDSGVAKFAGIDSQKKMGHSDNVFMITVAKEVTSAGTQVVITGPKQVVG